MGKEVERLKSAIQRTIATKQDVPNYLSGLLGIYRDGRRLVKVPNRVGYVYVRIGGNASEVIEAVNAAVPSTYDTKVLITIDSFNPGTYVVIGRDYGQYTTYTDLGSVVPSHGGSHSFGTGSDPVFIYRRQMVQPLMPRPTNPRSFQIYVEPDFYLWNGQFQYFAGGLSPDLSLLKPTDGTVARYVTVFLDGNSNSIQLMTGATFPIFPFEVTGSVYFIPEVAFDNGIALAAVLLKTGTTDIGWAEQKDLRMFLGGGSAIGTFITGSVLFAAPNGSVTEDNSTFFWDNTNKKLFLGSNKVPYSSFNASLQIIKENNPAGITVVNFSTGSVSAPFLTFYASRGTSTNRLPILSGTNFGRINATAQVGNGTDVFVDIPLSPPATIDFTSTENWNTGSYGNVISFQVTPTGSITKVEALRINSDSIDIVGKKLKLDADIQFDPTGALTGMGLIFNGTKWIPGLITGSSSSHTHQRHRLAVISGTSAFYLSGTANAIEFISFNGFIADPDGYSLVSGNTYVSMDNPLNTNGIFTINFIV